MKKLSLIALLFSIAILSGCGIVSKPEALLGECDNPYLEEEIGSSLVSSLPECIAENLIDTGFVYIDDLVKNCTQKQKTGYYYQGKSRGPGYKYKIFDNEIFVYDESKSVPKSVICKHKTENNEYELYSRFRPGTGLDCDDYLYTQEFDKSQYDTLKRVLGKGIIDEIALATSEPRHSQDAPYELCGPDEHCQSSDINDMLDYGERTDGKNYFVAGYRNNKLVYIINDKFYIPGEDNISKRYFAGIKNNKIIVKGIKDIKIEEGPDSKSTFTLETCEIDL